MSESTCKEESLVVGGICHYYANGMVVKTSLCFIWCINKASGQGMHDMYAVAGTRFISQRSVFDGCRLAPRENVCFCFCFKLPIVCFDRPDCSLSRQRDYHAEAEAAAAEQRNSAEITRWAKCVYIRMYPVPRPFLCNVCLELGAGQGGKGLLLRPCR